MKQYKKIIEIMNKINTSINFQQLLSIIIDSATNLLNAEGASLLLLDEKNEELIFDIVISDKGEIIRGRRLKRGEGIAWHVALSGQPIVVNDVREDSRFCGKIDSSTGFKTRNLIAVPVNKKDKLIGVLEVVNSLSDEAFSDRDIDMLDYIADAAAISIDNHELVISLKNRVDELTCIYEISQSIYFTFDIREFLYRILTAVNKVISAEKCSFLILEADSKRIAHFVSTSDVQHDIDLENSLMYHVIKTKDPLLVHNIDENNLFLKNIESRAKYRSSSFICVPMKLRDRIIGVLNVTDKPNGAIFDSFDLRVLATVANQVAETYVNVLYQKNNVERQKIETELKIASDIQNQALSLIPDSIKDMSVGAFTLPSSSIGGDFFEVTAFSDTLYGFSVGDVSGKGIPASLFMTTVRNSLRFEAIRHRQPALLLEKINRWVYQESRQGMFCTFFYCLVDTREKIIEYSSAGHYPQLYYDARGDNFLLINTSGKALGIDDHADYIHFNKPYSPGDYIILFTDGLVDQLFEGELTLEQLQTYIRRNRHLDAQSLTDLIRKDLEEKQRKVNLMDDCTLLIVRFD